MIGSLAWLPIALFAASAALLFVSAGFAINAADAAARVVQLGVGIAAATILMHRRDSRAIGIGLNILLQTLVIAAAAMMLTYAAATSGRPLADATLLTADRAIGYDWSAYARLFASDTLPSRVVLATYDSIFVQPLLLIAILIATGRVRRLEQLVLATLIALLVTAALFALFPATTAWVHLRIAAPELVARFHHHLPLAGDGWVRDLLEIRQGGGRRLTPDSASGLVAFPSYHCIAALLNVWAIWPARRWRPAFLILNACTIASAPIVGGHYAVDLIGGAIVMLASVTAAARLHAALLGLRRYRGWSSLAEAAGTA